MAERAATHKHYHRAYKKLDAACVDRGLCDQLSDSAWQNHVKRLTVPARSGLAWELKAGQTCRVSTSHGSQVGDVNIWNLHDFSERFYSGKTRQIHRSHLSTYDRLWSCMPYERPLATVTKDSLHYGFDADGLSVHDVIGTRCDPYIHRLMTGSLGESTCHQNLRDAILPWGLAETDVHDVFNIFMCSGFLRDTGEYVIRGSPAVAGDYIEWVADADLLVAISACPYGDVSTVCGQPVPSEICHPLDVVIGQPDETLVQSWLNKHGRPSSTA